MVSTEESAQAEIRHFYGVYLLCSRSELARFSKRCYIGYTVNPNRRITQHNRGTAYGGARKTSNRGPWTMVLIVHGFPNSISALRFEWAWQKPKDSRRLRCIPELQRKRNQESHFEYNFRILAEMLRTAPWTRLPLTVRWLSNEFICDFPIGKTPPVHMDISYGRVRIKAKSKKAEFALQENLAQIQTTQKTLCCRICQLQIAANASITCLNPLCEALFHMVCLASHILQPGEYVPVAGECPQCRRELIWGQLIRKRNGCVDLQQGTTATDCAETLTWSDVDDDQ